MSRQRRQDEAERRLLAEVQSGMSGLGWCVPTLADDVSRVEEELARADLDALHLPEQLADPADVFARTRPGSAAEAGRELSALQRLAVRFGHPGADDVSASLARAAREAGRLSEAVEERMRRDRARAERNAGVLGADESEADDGSTMDPTE